MQAIKLTHFSKPDHIGSVDSIKKKDVEKHTIYSFIGSGNILYNFSLYQDSENYTMYLSVPSKSDIRKIELASTLDDSRRKIKDVMITVGFNSQDETTLEVSTLELGIEMEIEEKAEEPLYIRIYLEDNSYKGEPDSIEMNVSKKEDSTYFHYSVGKQTFLEGRTQEVENGKTYTIAGLKELLDTKKAKVVICGRVPQTGTQFEDFFFTNLVSAIAVENSKPLDTVVELYVKGGELRGKVKEGGTVIHNITFYTDSTEKYGVLVEFEDKLIPGRATKAKILEMTPEINIKIEYYVEEEEIQFIYRDDLQELLTTDRVSFQYEGKEIKDLETFKKLIPSK